VTILNTSGSRSYKRKFGGTLTTYSRLIACRWRALRMAREAYKRLFRLRQAMSWKLGKSK
jgi:hypothetical protein